MHQQTEGHADPAVGLFNIFGGHAGRSFLMGAVAGFMRGDGVMGSLQAPCSTGCSLPPR